MIKIQHPTSFFRYRLAGLAIIAGLIAATPVFDVFAQSAAKVVGTLDADAQGTIPNGAAVRVHVPSGSPEVQAIADLFRDALEGSGYPPATGKGYVLSFQISGDSPDAGGRSGLELRGDRGSSGSGNVELQMRWKMKRDGASPPRRGRRLLVGLVDGDQGQVWQARIEIQANDVDDLAMVKAVMPALMANFGRSVYALRVP